MKDLHQAYACERALRLAKNALPPTALRGVRLVRLEGTRTPWCLCLAHWLHEHSRVQWSTLAAFKTRREARAALRSLKEGAK